MQTNSPHPITGPAPGLLDLTPTLQTIPSLPKGPGYACLPPLVFLLLADRLAALYEMVFPDHPEWLDGEVVNWVDEEEAGAATERFLGRVSRLFPVQDEFWEADLDTIEWRLDEIPVMPMGYDTWHEDWEHFKEPAPYLLHLCYSRGEEGSPYLRNAFADLYPEQLLPHDLRPHRLVETLRQMLLPEPLDALPDLIEMLGHHSGNFWLDVGEIALAESDGYPLWDREEVEWLTQEWQKAKPALERVNRLLDWQQDSPEEMAVGATAVRVTAAKLTAVRDALLQAYKRKQQDEPADDTTPPIAP
jgi:hypothetical protein